MDFHELTYIVTIAKYQNLSKAAQELYVSQPTLSKFVQSLEYKFGQPIFKRLGNKFVLTYAGNRYVEYARIILAAKKDLDNELSDIMRHDIGEMKIGFPFIRSNYMLPNTLPVFSAQYPNVKLEILEADSRKLENSLLDGSIDLAFLPLPLHSQDLTVEEISIEEFVLVMSQDHPIFQNHSGKKGGRYPWLDLREIKDERILMQKHGQRNRAIADRLLDEAGISSASILELRDISAAVQLAALGYGVCFIKDSLLRHIQCSPAVFSVGNPCTETGFAAVYRKGVYLPPYMRAYIQIVREFT